MSPSARISAVSTRSSPISYDEAEHRSDMERAQALEEALAKLEDGASGRRYAYRRLSNETYLRYFLSFEVDL